MKLLAHYYKMPNVCSHISELCGKGQQATKVLAKAGQTEGQSAVFHCSALVRAGRTTLNFTS